MGFQGKNPATDFRATGLLGLKHLVYIAENYRDRFRRMINEQALRDPAKQYPVAAAGINISQLLVNVFLDQTSENQSDIILTSSDIFPVLLHPNGYCELYCAIFELLDEKWRELVSFVSSFFQIIKMKKKNLKRMLNICNSILYLKK